MKRFAFALFTLTISFMTHASANLEQFSTHELRGQDGRTYPYRLLKPENYDPARAYPVVLFLHGAGERGTDNQIQLKNGVEVFVRQPLRAKFPCFVVVPQCPAGEQWVNMPWDTDSGSRPSEISIPLAHALMILDAVEAEYNIDRDREYVTGISMGGYGTWDCLTRFPDRFAAAIPVCGGGDESTISKEAAGVPLWAFHSADDGVVKVHRSRNMIAALEHQGGRPHYTEYPSEGHSSWSRAFDERDLFPWIFSQRRGQADSFTITSQR